MEALLNNEPVRIPNIENYTQEIINGELILTPKKKYITEDDLIMNTQIKHSTIEECLIKQKEKIISTKKNYKGVLVDIFIFMLKSMPAQNIIDTTKFNLKLTNEKGENGSKWRDDIKMSFQNKDASETLKEILRMIKVNNLTINLCIKLETGRIVYFKKE